MINPLAPLAVDSPLVKKFEKEFHKSDLLQLLSEFSFGVSISYLRNPMMDSDQQAQLIHKVIWLLKHRLLLQIHTYVFLIPLNCSMPYLTKKVNNYMSLSGKHNHNTSNDSSSASYDMKHQRASIETNEQMDISVESGSSYSENDSLETASPINFNINNTNSTASTANLNNLNSSSTLISNSYPQQNYMHNSSFDNNRFDLNFSSSLSTKKLHRSSLNIASSESKMLNAEVIINRHAMVQQHQIHQQQHQQRKQLQKQIQQTNELLELERDGSSLTAGTSSTNQHKKSADIAEDTEEDELSIEDNYSGPIEENRLEMLKELGLNKAECECILNIPASQNFDDLRLFVRLCPFFNGKHHLEDIMYYANVRRSALLALIDKFRDVLYTTSYEDEAGNIMIRTINL